MIIVIAILGGIGLGVYRARKLGGKALDMAQYGAAHGMAFGILGLLVTVILERSLT